MSNLLGCREQKTRKLTADAQLQFENEQARLVAREKRKKSRSATATSIAAGTALVAPAIRDTGSKKKSPTNSSVVDSPVVVDASEGKSSEEDASRDVSSNLENASSDLGKGRRTRKLTVEAQLQLENEKARLLAREKRKKSRAASAASTAAGTAVVALSMRDTGSEKKSLTNGLVVDSPVVVDASGGKSSKEVAFRDVSSNQENASNVLGKGKRTRKLTAEAQLQLENEQARLVAREKRNKSRAAAGTAGGGGVDSAVDGGARDNTAKLSSRKRTESDRSPDTGAQKMPASKRQSKTASVKKPRKTAPKLVGNSTTESENDEGSESTSSANTPPAAVATNGITIDLSSTHQPDPMVTFLAHENALKAQRDELQREHAVQIAFLKQKHQAVINALRDKLEQQEFDKRRKLVARNDKLQAELAESNKKQKADARKVKKMERELEQLKDADNGDPRRRKRKLSVKNSQLWDQRFEELKAYKASHGTCLVPTTQYPELGYWVSRQRTNQKLYASGKESSITSEQIQKLDSIGMVWGNLLHRSVSWEERYQQLLDYKAKHGHVRVPHLLKEPHGLGEFVQAMRSAYKSLNNNDSTSKPRKITPEQVEKLEAIGFEWSLRTRGTKEKHRLAASLEESQEIMEEPFPLH